jgi:hypothetical protein
MIYILTEVQKDLLKTISITNKNLKDNRLKKGLRSDRKNITLNLTVKNNTGLNISLQLT